MKLRLQSNSIRLRLKQGEVKELVQTGILKETVTLGSGPAGSFRYALEASDRVSAPQAVLQDNGIIVQVPTKSIRHWASSDEVGIEVDQVINDQEKLHVLIEKDFACVEGPPEENIDTFPNPLATVNEV